MPHRTKVQETTVQQPTEVPEPTEVQPTTEVQVNTGDQQTTEDQESIVYEKWKVYEIPVDQIQPNPNQPRQNFDPAALKELRDSIEQCGLWQPILFYRDETTQQLVIVDGERRRRVAQELNLSTIPGVFIGEHPVEVALVTNIVREPLNAIELSESMNKLKEEHEYTDEHLGKLIGKARTTVTEILSLKGLHPTIKDECRQNSKFPQSVLVELAKLANPNSQVPLYEKFKNRKTTREQIRTEVRHRTKSKAEFVADSIKPMTDRLKYINRLGN